MKLLHWVYPSLVGILLGLLQTGLFFQLTFTLSSSFRTFLMITVCWLLGSAVGIRIAKPVRLHLNGFALLSLLAYFTCFVLLGATPFNTQLWPVYAVFIMLTGLYPGVFFVRLSKYYTARQLFFRENNGFIVGLVSGTLLFLMLGRVTLWGTPILVAAVVMFCTLFFFQSSVRLNSPHETRLQSIEETAQK
jgi:hypothetical protein